MNKVKILKSVGQFVPYLFVLSSLLLLTNWRYCPDLALPAVNFDLVNLYESVLSLTVIKDGETVPLLERTSLEESYQLPKGRYRMVFYHGQQELGQIQGVCTVGHLVGCEAEDAGQNAVPVIRIERNADGVSSVTLLQNGLCP